MKFTKEEKLYCIENNLDIQVNRIQYERYILDNVMFNLDSIGLFDNKYVEFVNKYGHNVYQCCVNINNAFYHRKSRLHKVIYSMLNHSVCVFLTLTFNPKTLSNTNYDTRRKYVRDFLKSQNDYYVANIDFGDKKGREHYHAIICGDNIDYTAWKYGSINGRRIDNDEKSIDCISKYVTRLSNHALKKSTGKAHYLIYGKKIKELTLK